MADSSYYYNLYRQKKKEVNSYDDDLKDIEKALDNLTGTMSDEIRAVNNEIDDLISDLNKGVRHDGIFSSNASKLISEKEKAVTADGYLSVAVSELEDEVARIKNARANAEDDKDYYYRKYKAKKEEERQALLNKIF